MSLYLEIGPWLFGAIFVLALAWIARKPTSTPPKEPTYPKTNLYQ